ncbi:MAG: GntR family transcriptional regulator [Bacillota bacterium]
MATIKYMQIMADLKEQIEMGILAPGDILPSENSLSNQYGVSRMSSRKGLLLLAEKGYIYAIPGKGYYVSQPRYNKHILYFDETDFIKKYVDEVKLHQVDIVPASDEVAKELRIPNNKKVIVVKNIFLADDVPIAYDVKYLPYDKGQPNIEDEIGYATFPEIVTSQFSLFSVKKELKIWPDLSNEESSKLLCLKEIHPLLVIEQKCINNDGKPIVWGRMHIKREYSKLYAVSSL